MLITQSQYPNPKLSIFPNLALSETKISFQVAKDKAIAVETIENIFALFFDFKNRKTLKKYRGFASQINHSNTPPPRIDNPPIIKVAIPDNVLSSRSLDEIAVWVNEIIYMIKLTRT